MRIATSHKSLFIVLALVIFIIIVAITYIILANRRNSPTFDGQKAYTDVIYQVNLGPRTLGSSAHDKEVTWIIEQLKAADWQVETQEAVISGQTITNIIAKRGTGIPWIILGSHYDSRLTADQDPNIANHKLPVPGADDGASSPAALLELARVIPKSLQKQIWLVFFDAEDTGTSSGTGWANGSDYFVSQLSGKPDGVVILDMIGDNNLNIYMEGNSDNGMNQEIWGVAKGLGYSQFIPQYKYNLIDDHIPFIKAGIKAVDVIDFDYPYWHTISDTPDKVSAESLQIVGNTILKWLEEYPKATTQ